MAQFEGEKGTSPGWLDQSGDFFVPYCGCIVCLNVRCELLGIVIADSVGMSVPPWWIKSLTEPGQEGVSPRSMAENDLNNKGEIS